MVLKILPPNATIADVLPTLAKPVDYICGVLEHMYKCRNMHGNARVVIGTSGKGLKPYYRVIYETVEGPEVYDTFFDNHVSFAKENRPIEGGPSWSNQGMSFEEVAQIRGTLKG